MKREVDSSCPCLFKTGKQRAVFTTCSYPDLDGKEADWILSRACCSGKKSLWSKRTKKYIFQKRQKAKKILSARRDFSHRVSSTHVVSNLTSRREYGMTTSSRKQRPEFPKSNYDEFTLQPSGTKISPSFFLINSVCSILLLSTPYFIKIKSNLPYHAHGDYFRSYKAFVCLSTSLFKYNLDFFVQKCNQRWRFYITIIYLLNLFSKTTNNILIVSSFATYKNFKIVNFIAFCISFCY